MITTNSSSVGQPGDHHAKGKKADQGKSGVNKMEAVRQVITKHGKHVLPAEIVKLVKEEHGAVLTMQMASTYKSAALRKLGLGGKRRRRRKLVVQAGAVSQPRPKADGSISMDDIGAVKALCDRIGAEKVQQLAGVLAK